MKYKTLPILQGLIKDYHRRVIPDNRLADGKNIVFDEGKTKCRWGYETLGGQLLDPLSAIVYYDQLRTSNEWLIAITTRDTYRYNAPTNTWKFITKKYCTGTVGCAGATTVTSAGAPDPVFDHANWPVTVCQIKFGTTDINGAGTPDTWHAIATWTNATTLELATNGPNTGGDVAYVIRICWSGTESIFHDIAQPIANATNEKMVVITNGIDPIQYWAGSNECADLADLGDTPNIARYIAVYYNKLVLGWIIDTGVDYPQTIECSVIGDPSDWTGAGHALYDLVDSDDEIVGMKTLSTRLIVYKEKSITVLWATGQAPNPFSYNENIISMGTPSIRTVVDMGKYHIFMGWSDIWMFDGINKKSIGGDITKYMFAGINTEHIKKSFAILIKEKNLYCLFVPSSTSDYPDQCYVYDYVQKIWSYWELANNMIVNSYYFTDLSLIWNDLMISEGEYNTGTVTTSGVGDRTVTLVAGTWDTAWTRVSIKFNTADHQAAGTWYKVASMDSTTTLTLAEDGPSVAGVVFTIGEGKKWSELGSRWRDSLVAKDSKKIVLGDKDNNVFIMGFDMINDNGTNIDIYLETKDHPLNDPRHSFKLFENVLGMVKQLVGNEARLRASIDSGNEWSEWRTFDMFGNANYVEHICNFVLRGKQVRFRLENIDGSPIEIESMNIGFEDAGL